MPNDQDYKDLTRGNRRNLPMNVDAKPKRPAALKPFVPKPWKPKRIKVQSLKTGAVSQAAEKMKPSKPKRQGKVRGKGSVWALSGGLPSLGKRR